MEFELNDVKLKLDGNQLYDWFDTNGGRKLKNPQWRFKKKNINENGYCSTSIGGRSFKFHRIVYYAHNPEWNIWDASDDNQIDHIDRNRSNNIISNLRVVTRKENAENTIRCENAKGYYYIKSSGKYRVRFRRKHVGCYNTEQEAKDVYREIKAKYMESLG